MLILYQLAEYFSIMHTKNKYISPVIVKTNVFLDLLVKATNIETKVLSMDNCFTASKLAFNADTIVALNFEALHQKMTALLQNRAARQSVSGVISSTRT
jgi:hypothetical protein